MYFYNFAIFSAEKVYKPLTFRRKIKEFQQVQPVCHDFCHVPFRFFSFFFQRSGSVHFVTLHEHHHAYLSSKSGFGHSFIPLLSIHSFPQPHLLYTKKNFTSHKNRAKPAVCGNPADECVRFYNFVNLSADSNQVCLEFIRFLQKKYSAILTITIKSILL